MSLPFQVQADVFPTFLWYTGSDKEAWGGGWSARNVFLTTKHLGANKAAGHTCPYRVAGVADVIPFPVLFCILKNFSKLSKYKRAPFMSAYLCIHAHVPYQHTG